jgi:dienelactone hydrolase
MVIFIKKSPTPSGATIFGMEKHSHRSRRNFIKSAAAVGSFPFLPVSLNLFDTTWHMDLSDNQRSIIGHYGPWAATLVDDPAPLSFRNQKWSDIENWKKAAREKLLELLAAPDAGPPPRATIHKKYHYDGLEVEELSWQLPYGRPTEAILLKPQGAKGPLPGVLGLHDHGGNKYLGKRKITRVSEDTPAFVVEHQEESYEGLPWANEIAKRGYVVLVHDTFAFGSRRILYQDVTGIAWGACNVDGKSDANPEDPDNIEAYNQWAGEHEHILSKSLFCGGTTWPGVFLAEDRIALDILSQRPEVDPGRIGCGGLSGGGLRTVYLGGVDPRIQCAVCAGFLTTWEDFLLNKSYTHTWMTYTPLLPRYMDFPEILGLRVPLPTMSLNDIDDELYTMDGMTRGDRILKEVYAKAGASDHYEGRFYPGPHKLDARMQKDAFDWFDRWLK